MTSKIDLVFTKAYKTTKYLIINKIQIILSQNKGYKPLCLFHLNSFIDNLIKINLRYLLVCTHELHRIFH